MAKGGLGRGLDSLFSDNTPDSSAPVTLRLSEIEPNRNQPRKNFEQTALEELAASIREYGLLQPILVRPMMGGRYQIVAGERRWRACRIAGLDSVPVIIREMDDLETMQIALIENLQRENLDPIEEAEGYRELIDHFGMSLDEVADKVGKSRPAVSNSLRLLSLNDREKEQLVKGRITQGHARALLSISNPDLRERGLKMAMSGATVREIERLRAPSTPKKPYLPTQNTIHRDKYSEFRLALQQELGRKVDITTNSTGGTIHIDFYSDEELYDFARRLSRER